MKTTVKYDPKWSLPAHFKDTFHCLTTLHVTSSSLFVFGPLKNSFLEVGFSFHTIHPFYYRVYLFIFREEKGERKRGKHQCVVASRAHYWGPGQQPKHVP